MRLPLLVMMVLVGTTCSSTPPAACSGDAACSGGRCIAGACYPKACDAQTCGLAQVCQGGVCVDELCITKTCDPGTTCLRGDCLSTKCGTQQCPAGQVCDANVCIDASCYGVLCPSGQTCAGGVCSGTTTCGGATCTATQACVASVCVDKCGAVNCTATQACVASVCVDKCGAVNCTATQACVASTCVEKCGAVNCASGQGCDQGACVETACVGVRCDGGVCQAGVCRGVCDVTCTRPMCPACTNGRTCAGTLECESRFCNASSVCAACSAPADCPNGGLCMNGICRSGLLGPCESTLDCKPGNLVCDDGKCRLPANAACVMNPECILSLRCENLVCQRPRCLLQLLETQTVPGFDAPLAQGMGLNDAGELYVTNGQWNAGFGSDVRRYRVRPGGDAGIVEQQPTTAPLIALPQAHLSQGHSDVPGTATNGFFGSASSRSFFWIPAGGAFDGRPAVEVQFTGFNADVFINFTNVGRFAKCGDNFYFAAQTTAGRAILRFTTPNPVGSGTVAQVLSASAQRRDNGVFTFFVDLACTPTTLFVHGVDSSGRAALAMLDPLTLAEKVPSKSFANIPANSSVGDVMVAPVSDDYVYLLGVRGEAMQVWDGGATILSATAYSAIQSNATSANANATGPVLHYGYDSKVRRYARRLMDGTEPPPSLDCNWQ